MRVTVLRGLAAVALISATDAISAMAQITHASADTTRQSRTSIVQTPAQVLEAEAAMGTKMSAADVKAMAAHMQMTSSWPRNAQDSTRAAGLVKELRGSIGKYRDVSLAVADGFRQFAPQLKNQRVYHFTNYRWAFENAFRFNPEKPTSLLYKKDSAGNFVLIGAMYTAPKRYSEKDLDKRVPLSIAQWHKHVNWCLPPKGSETLWLAKKNGRPVFGPLGVATQKECDEAGGRFEKEVFGWMVHANVFSSDDPNIIWHDDHGMSGDEMMDRDHH